MESPLKFERIDQETEEMLLEMYKGCTTGFVRIQPGNVLVSDVLLQRYEQISTMPIRPDDIYVLSWPKTGTTWTQELVWMVYHGGDTKDTDQTEKWRFLEYMSTVVDDMMKAGKEDAFKETDVYKALHMESPRFLKSHLPMSLLPPKVIDTCKVVYVARNPMDTCVSWYHHAANMKSHGWKGTFQEFFNCFINDNVRYSPYWNHVKEAWALRHHPNMCFLFYEDLKQDLPSNIQKVATFLERTVSSEEVQKLCDYLSFDKMKKNPLVNKASLIKTGSWDKGSWEKGAQFIRKGIVGDWKNYFTEEMTDQMKQWCKKNAEECGISFPGVPLW